MHIKYMERRPGGARLKSLYPMMNLRLKCRRVADCLVNLIHGSRLNHLRRLTPAGSFGTTTAAVVGPGVGGPVAGATALTGTTVGGGAPVYRAA